MCGSVRCWNPLCGNDAAPLSEAGLTRTETRSGAWRGFMEHSARAALSRLEVKKDFRDAGPSPTTLCCWRHHHGDALSVGVSTATPSVDTPRGGFLQAGASRRRFFFHFSSICSVKKSSRTNTCMRFFLTWTFRNNQKQKNKTFFLI